jgi:hypothetical protein
MGETPEETALKDLMEACRRGSGVVVVRDALLTARLQFELHTTQRVLRFLLHREGEIEYHNTRSAERDPSITIYAYHFMGPFAVPGYLAFYYGADGRTLVVKSMHIDDYAAS